MNPPYGRTMNLWMAKAHAETASPDTLVVGLVPARTDTRWFHEHVWDAGASALFLKGRVRFEQDGIPSHPAPFGSMIVLWPGTTGATLDAIAHGQPILHPSTT